MENLFPLESTWFCAIPAAILAGYMLWRLSKTLPIQNLVMICVCILLGEAVTDYLLARYSWVEVDTSLWIYAGGAALLWLAIVLSCRKLAQLVLEPWRRQKAYGLWMIGIASVLAGLFQFGWPSFNPDPVPEWRAALMALIRMATTAAFLAALSPWFIRKRPVSRMAKSKLPQEPQNKTEQGAEK